MKFLARVWSFFPKHFTQQIATKQARFECPNCWGTQQYENVEHPAADILGKDTTTIGRSRQGFIQRFANRYLARPIRRI